MNTKTDLITKKQAFSLTSHDELVEMREVLSEGPMRFAPALPERSIEEQLLSLSDKERECFEALSDAWDARYPLEGLSDELVLRYARNSPGTERFDKKSAWKGMALLHKHASVVKQLSLTVANMEEQIMTKTLFPLPGLKTKDNNDVFYMRPARYSPEVTATHVVIDNLAYCMNSMVEKESACTDGIAFIANMDGWTLQHYGTDYCLKVSEGSELQNANT
jgi:hypothetical protein